MPIPTLAEIADNLVTRVSTENDWLIPSIVINMVREVSGKALEAIPINEDGTKADYEETPLGLDSRRGRSSMDVNFNSWSSRYSQSYSTSQPKTFHRLYRLVKPGETPEQVETIGEFSITGNYIFSPQGVIDVVRNVLGNPQDTTTRANLTYIQSGHRVERQPKDRPKSEPTPYYRPPRRSTPGESGGYSSSSGNSHWGW